MCGIVGYTGDKQAVPILMYGLSKLEYRGYDSAGVAIYNNGQVSVKKCKGRLAVLEKALEADPYPGTLGIGHTRWATHGAPSDINSHPQTSSENTISIVHNGIIENFMDLKDELEKEGVRFVSETDTETVAHLINHYYKQGNTLLDSVYMTIAKVEGSYALGVMCSDFKDTIIAARKDSPLVVGLGNGENFIASDMPAILNYTRNVYLLGEQEVAVVTANNVELYDKDKKPIVKEVYTVNWDIEAAEKGGYDYFMLKEIHEQAKVVRDTLSPRLRNDGINLDDIETDMNKINKIYMVACGTASYAAQIGRYLIEHMCHIPVIADIASEFRYNDPIIDENTLVILVSQSGETADTLAALRLAKKKGSRVLAVVNVVGSSIAREADDILYTMAGPEIAVASTKAYSAQVAAMYLLACHFALKTNKLTLEEYTALKKDLDELPKLIDIILTRSSRIEEFTKKYIQSKNVFYIGRGMDYLTCLEGSLKLKEIAYIHSEPYAAGELKHGPIALIEESTLIVGVVTQESVLEKTISNIKECKARGARVLAIANEGNEIIGKVADDVFYIPKTNYLFTPVLANIPQQLFAYFMATGLGNDVDKPRNLAKSVTVE